MDLFELYNAIDTDSQDTISLSNKEIVDIMRELISELKYKYETAQKSLLELKANPDNYETYEFNVLMFHYNAVQEKLENEIYKERGFII